MSPANEGFPEDEAIALDLAGILQEEAVLRGGKAGLLDIFPEGLTSQFPCFWTIAGAAALNRVHEIHEGRQIVPVEVAN